MTLHSLKLSGLSIKGNGQTLAVQTDSVPSTTVFSVNTSTSQVIVSGTLRADTIKGKTLATSEVLVDAASVIDLDKDITIFANTAIATATLDPGTDGQVKYVSKTTIGTGGETVTITKPGGIGDLVGVGKTSVRLDNVGSGATLVYNTAQGLWCLAGAWDVTLA